MTDTAATKGLAEAVLALQADLPTLPKDAENPHFKSKFTPLDTMVEIVGPLLTKHRLVWTTLPGRDSTGEPALGYHLEHVDSGESWEGDIPLMPVKPDPQALGSALTYARRYSMSAVLNLVADEDNDGNHREPAGVTLPPASDKTKGQLKNALSWLLPEEQAKEVWGAVKEITDGELSEPVAALLVDVIARRKVIDEPPTKAEPPAKEGEGGDAS